MSQANVAIIRRGYEAFAEGEVAFELLDPEIEWHGPSEYPDLAGPYHGHDGVRRYLETLSEVFEDYRMVPEEFVDAGTDQVLVFSREGGRGKGSGAVVHTHPTGHLWTIRDGKAVHMQSYWERGEALEAAGISEYAMSQEHVEIVRKLFDSFTNRGDLQASAELLDESIVFDTRGMEWEDEDFARVYFGREGVRDFWRAWLPAWSNMRVDVQWIRGAGDRVLVWLHQRQVGRVSGVPVEFLVAWDIQFRDGKIVRVGFFRNEQKALEAVGLSE